MFDPLAYGARPVNTQQQNTGMQFDPYEHGARNVGASWGDRAKEFGQGVASGVGGLVDTANKYVAAGVVHAGGLAADAVGAKGLAQKAYNLGGQYQNSNVADSFANSEALQTNNTPDSTSQVLKAAGSGVADFVPFAGAGKVANIADKAINSVQLVTKSGAQVAAPWLKKLNDFLRVPVGNSKEIATAAASFAGMGAGAELAKDPNASAGENALREVLGGIMGGSVSPLATGAAKGVYNLFRHPIESVGNTGVAAVASFNRGKLNTEAIEAAKKIGLQLPPSLATDSTVANFIEESALKSVYASKAYNKVIEDIPQKLIQEIEKNLDKVGTKIAANGDQTALQTASDSYGNALLEQKDVWKEQSQKLFDNAKSQLTNVDVIKPTKTLNFIEETAAELSKSVGKAPEEKTSVVNYLNNFAEEIRKGYFSNIDTMTGKPSGTPVANLMTKQQELLNLGKYGEDAGYKNFYSKVASVLTDELVGYKGNKAFAENYLPARNFYRENIVEKLKSSTARRLLKAELPKEALDFMNTSSSVKELERVLGNHGNAKEIMGTLKRAKLGQLLQDKNIITTDGQFNSKAFLNTFDKESKEPLLKTLMGENYNSVQKNITPIARAIETAGKNSLKLTEKTNPAKDIALGGGAVLGALTGHTSTAAGAGGGIALINLVSRAFASPKYLEQLIARQNKVPFLERPMSPATKASLAKYGINEALPTAASTISDGLMGGEFTGEVKRMYDDGKKKKESLKR